MRCWSACIVPPTLDGRTLDLLTESLTQLNCWFLEDNPDAPLLYASGVRYSHDEDALSGRPEQWHSIPHTIDRWERLGLGADCKRLAAWRCAELRVRHRERARCDHDEREDPYGRLLFHVFVRRADGSIEDPSEILGMVEHVAANPLPAPMLMAAGLPLVAGWPWRKRPWPFR